MLYSLNLNPGAEFFTSEHNCGGSGRKSVEKVYTTLVREGKEWPML
jgi:hypothetical protein